MFDYYLLILTGTERHTFVYSIHLIEIAIGIVIDWSSLLLKKLLIQKH
jgi:hypothetical protein